jgi:hypothetical protein
MALLQACAHHVNLATQHSGEVKLYAECTVTHIDHRLIRAHLDAQSMGPKCQSLKPDYRAIPTSLLTVVGIPPAHQPLDSNLPTGLIQLHPNQQICCYRSVLCERLEDPQAAVQISIQHVLARNPFSFKVPHNCTLMLETVRDQVKASDLILPRYVQKENGTTYIPIAAGIERAFIVELFQVWRESTFAGLEFKSATRQKGTVPVFRVRVTAVSPLNTPSTLHALSQKLLNFIDLLVYG